MMTPMEIQTKQFDKAMMGYNKEDVDSFLDCITECYEALYNQAKDSERQIEALNEKLEFYKNIEDAMNQSLIAAQQTAETLQKSAEEKADLIVREAELKAKEITENANKSIAEAQSALAKMQHTMDIYKCQAISMLNAQIENLQKFEAKVNQGE